MVEFQDFINRCKSFVDIPHETEIKLKIYADLLLKWQKKINLVSQSTLGDIWNRHFLDSAQLMQFIAPNQKIVDLGSGAGFPGLVLAILGCHVTLIESDQRKCAFLAEVARETGITITLENSRIENVPPQPCDFVTARALASLHELLGYSEPYLRMGAKCLFLKGDNLLNELTFTERLWHMQYQRHESLTDPKASVLLITEARRTDDPA